MTPILPRRRPLASPPGGPRPLRALAAAAFIAAALTGCGDAPPEPPAMETEAAIVTNRVPIPAAVRRNLGIEFARVEPRVVERSLRIPGRFELLPSARRDHRAPLDGRVEILVDEFQTVEPGTPLYRISGSGWLDLQDRIATTRARLDSMDPVREAHRVHERSLAEKIEIWKSRLDQLETLRDAGGANATAVTQARATLNATQAELAEVLEKEAELVANEQVLQAELASLEARRTVLRGGACLDADDADGLLVCAVDSGVIDRRLVTPGAHVEEGDPILTVIQPDRLRVRAHALQSDLDDLRDGLAARIAAPTAERAARRASMPATIRLAPQAEADGRTIEILATPIELAEWARPGVAVSLEVVLAGGRTELAIPRRAVLDDGGVPILFRRDPADADQVIRLEADLGRDDGRWVELLSGVADGDEVVVAGHYQLMLATSDAQPTGGHFHADGTFHAEDH